MYGYRMRMICFIDTRDFSTRLWLDRYLGIAISQPSFSFMMSDRDFFHLGSPTPRVPWDLRIPEEKIQVVFANKGASWLVKHVTEQFQVQTNQNINWRKWAVTKTMVIYVYFCVYVYTYVYVWYGCFNKFLISHLIIRIPIKTNQYSGMS